MLPALAISTAPPVNPITVQQLLGAASGHHPSIRSAKRLADAAQQDIESARRRYWPEISVVAESNARNDRPGTSTQSARLQQTLFDFGQTANIVSEATATSQLSQAQILVEEQNLHLQVIGAWQQVIVSDMRLQIAQRSLDILAQYEALMQRRVKANASPRIDLELVRARIYQTQAEQTSAQTQLEGGIFSLEQLTGFTGLRFQVTALQTSLTTQDLQQSRLLLPDLLSDYVAHHPAVKAVQIEQKIIEAQLQTLKAAQLPSIYFRLEQPLNKTPPLNNTKASYFVGLSYNTGVGFIGLSQIQSQALRLQSAQEKINVVQLDVQRALNSDQLDLNNALMRIRASELSVSGASQILESYQRQFQAGRKSWLDLLTAARELSQAEFTLAEAKGSALGAYYRLLVRSGKELSQ